MEERERACQMRWVRGQRQGQILLSEYLEEGRLMRDTESTMGDRPH